MRIYLVYAEQDHRFRDQIATQARSGKLAVEFLDMPTKQPWVPNWKAVCRSRAHESDGAIVLIGKRTRQAEGVKWELECVNNAQIPVLAVAMEKVDASALPDELRGNKLVEWNWPEVQAFIAGLEGQSSMGMGR